MVFQGQRCARRDCQIRLHDICTQQFFRSRDSKACPTCKTAWTGNDFVGEKAAARMKEKPKRRKKSGLSDRSNGSIVRQQSPTIVEDDDDEEEHESVVESDG